MYGVTEFWYSFFIYLFIYCPDGQSIGESQVLKPLPMNELMLICIFKSSNRYFYEIKCSECGAYMFTIVMSA